MPKNGKQILALAVIGGLAAMGGGIVADVTKQGGGIGGFVATVAGGGLGAAVGIMVLGGKGVRLA